ncbi:MAG: WcaF family extracellular polysaccharide biosynthesis acetyltransferase [Cyclobacteriaceae bacterium]|nr:WcaF family extracellular polysaccharide biosynthesis acetyltransferase [Cyclobacteriaceae bacterium]
MKTNLASYDNRWYLPGAGWTKRIIWHYVNLIFLQSYWLPLSSLKIFILKWFGAKIGKGVNIKPGVNIKYPWLLRIGDHVWIGEGVWIDNLARVDIYDNVCLSQGAMLLTGNHNYKKSSFDLMVGEIVLEEGVWIGARAVVCPGVRCESHSVLGVCSVASSNLERYGIYNGNPAQKIRKRIIEST